MIKMISKSNNRSRLHLLQMYLVKTSGARPEKSLMAPSRTSTTALVLVRSILLGVRIMRLIKSVMNHY